jgi:hypothetical protein
MAHPSPRLAMRIRDARVWAGAPDIIETGPDLETSRGRQAAAQRAQGGRHRRMSSNRVRLWYYPESARSRPNVRRPDR